MTVFSNTLLSIILVCKDHSNLIVRNLDNRKQNTIFRTSYIDKEASRKTERAYLVAAVIVTGNSIVNAIVTNNILDI